MDGHHLILGKLTDVLTGETLPDTHDERYRQKLAHLLLEDKGYSKPDITSRCELVVAAADGRRAIIRIDFKISLSGKAGMILKYGPGSLVTRQRPALAAARLLEPYQIPLVVVSNGKEADILAGASGKKLSQGLAAIPAKADLERMMAGADFGAVSPQRAEMEARILYAFEVDGSCPCDDTVCRLE